jgi:archaemetzincin
MPPPTLADIAAYCSVFFARGGTAAAATVRVLPAIALDAGKPHKLSKRVNKDNGSQNCEIVWEDPEDQDDKDEENDDAGCSVFYSIRGRYHTGTRRRQLHVDDILSLLSKKFQSRRFRARHEDAFCLFAVTLEDLYSCDTDLFVAGMAAGLSKVAVFSLNRYDPLRGGSVEFWHVRPRITHSAAVAALAAQNAAMPSRCNSSSSSIIDTEKKKQKKQSQAQRLQTEWLLRGCRLCVHEIGHLLGIGHCKYYDCLMNGSGHLLEDVRQSNRLCPVDLAKLRFRFKFDIGARYTALLAVCVRFRFDHDAAWLRRRLIKHDVTYVRQCLGAKDTEAVLAVACSSSSSNNGSGSST